MSTIAMTKNHVLHVKSNHIELCHHFVKNLFNDGEIKLTFVNTEEQRVDPFTKPVSQKNWNISKIARALQIKQGCEILY